MHIPPLAEKRCEWTDNEGRAAIRLRRATFLLAAYGLEGDAVHVVEGGFLGLSAFQPARELAVEHKVHGGPGDAGVPVVQALPVRVVEGDGVRGIDEALLVEALDRM
jgi:hypothetical protein